MIYGTDKTDMTDYTPIDYDELVHETGDAVLIRIDEEKVWIPRSVIDGDLDEQEYNSLSVAVWFAEQEGLV